MPLKVACFAALLHGNRAVEQGFSARHAAPARIAIAPVAN